MDHSRWVVTAEGRGYADGGTPEARVWQAAGASGVPLAQLKVRGHLHKTASRTAPDWCFSQTALGSEVADVGFKQAMALKAVKLEKGEVPTVVRLVRGNEQDAP